MVGLFRPEGAKKVQMCGCEKTGSFVPQAVGDATILRNPGNITGSVPITNYNFHPQAASDINDRETLIYPSGSITGQIKVNPKERTVYHNVV
jgi:hypothetical protein